MNAVEPARQRKPPIPPRHRRKALIGGAALGVVVLFIGLNLVRTALGSPETPPPPPPPPVAAPAAGPMIPDHYLSEHFRNEVGACYAATGQPQAPVELERAIERLGRRAAALALMDQYRAGTCREPVDYRSIPGRALWLVDAVKAGSPED